MHDVPDSTRINRIKRFENYVKSSYKNEQSSGKNRARHGYSGDRSKIIA